MGFMPSFLKVEEQGPKAGDDAALAQRESFGKWLRLSSFDAADQSFRCSDETTGYAWACFPVTFMGPTVYTALKNQLSQTFTDDTLLQFILSPTSRIDAILDAYIKFKTRQEPVCQEAARRYADYLRQGAKGLERMSGIPVRTFRLLVCLKSKTRIKPEQVKTVEETLQAAGLAPERMTAGPMLEFFREIFNHELPANPQAWCENTLLRNQIIGAEYPVEHVKGEQGVMRVGGRYAACLTPKTLPAQAHPLKLNRLIGGYGGGDEDTTQIVNPFIVTANIWFRAGKNDIQSQANLLTMQRAGGSLAKKIGQRVKEVDWVLDDIETTAYVNISLSMWVFGEDLNNLNDGMARVRQLWEVQDFVMQRETTPGIVQAMLINSLPFGQIMNDNALKLMDRDFKVSAKAAAAMLPVQGDFAGHMKPILLFLGRKGQLVSIDVFDKRANNPHWFCVATTGSGKSFTTNTLVNNYYGAGALIRITDIGYSYRKQCHSVKGRYIDVGDPRERVVINPFQQPRTSDEEDKVNNRQNTANILLMMAHSTVGVHGLTQTHYGLMMDAVSYAYATDGGENGIDHAYEFLRSYPKLADEKSCLREAEALAHTMAFNMRDFCSTGVYGKLFNGKATFDISSDQFVVLELEKLLNNKSLFSVVSLQVMNAITQDLYLSDRSKMRFLLFDESPRYLMGGGNGTQEGGPSLLARVVEEGYRRARKYSGSLGVVAQSVLDLPKYGDVGKVILSNSAYRAYLESLDYQEAADTGVIQYQGLALDLLKSVKNRRPRYSEILLETPFGTGVARLCVDPWTYWMNTSAGEEVERYEALVAQGKSPLEAITELAGG